MDKKPTNKLSIYLIKDGLELEEILRAKPKPKSAEVDGVGTFYYIPAHSATPSWVKNFFGPKLDKREFISSSPKGVLLVAVGVAENEERIFALTFGYGRSLLEPGALEDRFGLKVTVNIADPGALRRIHKKHLASAPKDASEQLSRSGAMAEFGFDLEQDLLWSMTAQPRKEKREWFGKTVTGKDALSVSSKIDLSNVQDFLYICHGEYKSDYYKENFEWIDQIAELRIPKDIDRLNEQMTSNILKADRDKIWMAVPDLVEWAYVAGFSYGRLDTTAGALDINLDDFLSSLPDRARENFNLDTLKRKKVFCFDAQGNEIAGPWSAYDCLYCEIKDRQGTYLLNHGKWYQIKQGFVEKISQDYERLRENPPTLRLPQCTGQKENDYNETVARQVKKICCMDRKIIRHGGGYSQVEFCDLLTEDKEIIHVKRYGQSSVLGHLFQQGFVSGTLFLSDPEFREKVNKKLPPSHRLDDPSRAINPSDYTIIFAIISDRSGGRLDIPFFSKVVLQSKAQLLRNSGYKVKLMKINSTA